MKIRTKLTLQFVSIVAAIILTADIAVYFFSSNYREETFYTRLENKGNNTARLLIQITEIDVKLLQKIEEDKSSYTPKKIIIYDLEKNILFSTDDNLEIKISDDLRNKILLNGEARFTEGEYEALGFIFKDQNQKYIVVAAGIDVFGYMKLNHLKWLLIIVFGCSIFLTSVFGRIYAGRAMKPISNVIYKVNEISISKLDLRIDEGNRKDEIAQLAQTFNRMLARLESSFKVQKNFIANASHELRTPLTAITGQLEVVQLKQRQNGEYVDVISSVLDDIKNLNSISNRLLQLAQTDSENPRADFKPVRVDEIVWQSQIELARRNKNYKVNIRIDSSIEDDRSFTINGNDQLVKTVILNLMDNACKYSTDQSVDLEVKKLNTNLVLTFTDKGIGIPAEDIKHIFEPFHRAKNAMAFKGHGIGLSLVERIVDLHGGRITVRSEPGKGSVFTTVFPGI